MLDKIIKKSDKEFVLILTDRPPFTIYSSEGNAEQLTQWLLTPTAAPLTLAEFKSALDAEDTQCITLEVA